MRSMRERERERERDEKRERDMRGLRERDEKCV